MRVGGNLIASIGAACWAAVVGLAVVPYYIRMLGIEAFGLIGFFGTLQALFYILDLGLAATMNREMARFAAAGRKADAGRLLSTLGWFYWSLALLIGLIVVTGAPGIAHYWLRASTLPAEQISVSLMLMGVVIALRWPIGLYQGTLQGSERIVLASGISTAAITLANLGALAVLSVKPTLQAYFIWQALVTLLQVLFIRWAALRAVGNVSNWEFDIDELKRVWRFSAGLGVTAILAVTLMQLDKLILSRLVTLEAFGYYALAGLAPRALYLLLTPVFTVVYPRMSSLHALGDEASVISLYRNGTRALLTVLLPLATLVAAFATEIFTLWTGDAAIAAAAAPAAIFLLIGTAANGAMHFPYALQLAYGQSSLPARINLMLVALFVPLVILLATKFGIVGGGGAWAITNLFYLFVGTYLTHRVILRGIGKQWLFHDVGIPASVSLLIVGGAGILVHRLALPLHLALSAGIGAAMLATAVIIAMSPNLVRLARSFRGAGTTGSSQSR